MFYDRKEQCLKEQNEFQQGAVSFLYETVPGRILLRLAVSPWVSRLWGFYQKSPLSRRSIRPFANRYGIELTDDMLAGFGSFNDFFTRQKDIEIQADDPQALLAIADSKMRYYPISDDLQLRIKHSAYSIADILADAETAAAYKNGTCIVFRLGVDNYHRYQFPDRGQYVSRRKIKGVLHTVRPVSEKYHVFARNTREVSILETEHFGFVVQVEVGALLVGRIVNHEITAFERMQEKGYFEFGGSTIVLLLNRKISFDEDIIKMNDAGIEVFVRAGERIGVLCSGD